MSRSTTPTEEKKVDPPPTPNSLDCDVEGDSSPRESPLSPTRLSVILNTAVAMSNEEVSNTLLYFFRKDPCLRLRAGFFKNSLKERYGSPVVYPSIEPRSPVRVLPLRIPSFGGQKSVRVRGDCERGNGIGKRVKGEMFQGCLSPECSQLSEDYCRGELDTRKYGLSLEEGELTASFIVFDSGNLWNYLLSLYCANKATCEKDKKRSWGLFSLGSHAFSMSYTRED